MYKLKKNSNDKVSALLRSDKDFVKTELTLAGAQHLIDEGKLVKSDREDYPICVDSKWYFEGEVYDDTPQSGSRKRGKKNGN